MSDRKINSRFFNNRSNEAAVPDGEEVTKRLGKPVY